MAIGKRLASGLKWSGRALSRVNAEGLPPQYNRGSVYDILRGICSKLNQLSEGRIVERTNALTSIPTTGTFAQGDKVENSTPSEAGTVGSKYVVTGWICVVGGEPGTFKEMRVLTGN